MDTGEYIVDRFLCGVNVGSVPIALRSQGFLHLDADTVRDEIEHFVLHHFEAELHGIADDVLLFQREFVTSFDRNYPYEADFRHDVLSLMASEDGIGVPSRYSFDVVYSFDDRDDYLAKIYSRKKQGFGKASVRKAAGSVVEVEVNAHMRQGLHDVLGAGVVGDSMERPKIS